METTLCTEHCRIYKTHNFTLQKRLDFHPRDGFS